MELVGYKQLEKVRICYRVNHGFIELNVRNTDIIVSRLKVSSGAFDFNIDYIGREADGLTKVSGWSLDLNYRLPPKCLLVFENDKLIKIVKSMGHRPDVAKHFSSIVDYVGFEFDFNKKNGSDYSLVFIRPDNSVSIYDFESKL